jgi:hypothetical protein
MGAGGRYQSGRQRRGSRRSAGRGSVAEAGRPSSRASQSGRQRRGPCRPAERGGVAEAGRPPSRAPAVAPEDARAPRRHRRPDAVSASRRWPRSRRGASPSHPGPVRTVRCGPTRGASHSMFEMAVPASSQPGVRLVRGYARRPPPELRRARSRSPRWRRRPRAGPRADEDDGVPYRRLVGVTDVAKYDRP